MGTEVVVPLKGIGWVDLDNRIADPPFIFMWASKTPFFALVRVLARPNLDVRVFDCSLDHRPLYLSERWCTAIEL